MYDNITYLKKKGEETWQHAKVSPGKSLQNF
jgi:hypothetical protein